MTAQVPNPTPIGKVTNKPKLRNILENRQSLLFKTAKSSKVTKVQEDGGRAERPGGRRRKQAPGSCRGLRARGRSHQDQGPEPAPERALGH